MKLNISYPATAQQKVVEVEDERKLYVACARCRGVSGCRPRGASRMAVLWAWSPRGGLLRAPVPAPPAVPRVGVGATTVPVACPRGD